MRINLILLFILLVVSSKANATDYYIDYTSGSDANSGTSSGTPWKNVSNVTSSGFLQPGDNVYIAKGSHFVGADASFIVQSIGSASNHITISTYGSGAAPIFDGSTATSAISGWTGWTVYSGSIWKSNIPLPFNTLVPIANCPSCPAIYQDTSLGRAGNLSTLMLPGHFYLDGSNYVYVYMWDGSDPNSSTFSFAQYPATGTYRGLVGTGDGNVGYIDFIGLDVKGSNAMGFSSSGPYVTFTDCNSSYTAREGFYIIKNVTGNSTGGSHNTLTNITSKWAAGGSFGGSGQNVTIEAPYVDVINSTIEYGWMAGLDWLDYNSNTDATFGRAINNTIRYNSQRSLWSADYYGFDAQLLLDGASNIQLISNTVIGNASNATFTLAGQNAISGISITTEHPSTKPVNNIYVINNLSYANSFVPISSAVINGPPSNEIYKIYLYGNTFRTGNTGQDLLSFNGMNSTGRIYAKNNIFSNSGSNAYVLRYSEPTKFVSNYNLYYTNTSSKTFRNNTDVVDETLAQWVTNTGNDANSIFGNPLFVTSGSNNSYLSNTLAGDASNSPANAIGLNITDLYLGDFTFSSIGTVRTDSVVDSSTTPSAGYHYDSVFSSSKFPSIQVGTDYF